MPYPWANTVLLVLLAVQLLTGVGALLGGAPRSAWVTWTHAAGAYAICVVLFWKGAVIVRTIRRRPRVTANRVAFLLLTLLLAAVLGSGFLWSFTGPHALGGFTLLTVHGFLAVAALLLLLWHTLDKRWIWKAGRARDRRAFLRLGAISLAGAVFWLLERPVQAALGLSGADRRFTGSYETGSFTGVFPHVIWLFDNPPPVDETQWKLRVVGSVERPLAISFAELHELAAITQPALLDCTGGWYSTQEWTGVSLASLLEQAGVRPEARSITVESVTGYRRRFSLAEASDYLLATHVAGRPLDHGHGFPLRLVAPGKRGFEWVKWVTAIHANPTGPHRQLPVPLQ